jgi:Fur family ferric uptake transcriptional regulator
MSSKCQHNDHLCEPALTVEGLIDLCRAKGLRKTALMVSLLRLFLKCQKPISVQAIQADPKVGEICDTATVYRLLARLEEHGVVRRIGSHQRSMHYVLSVGNTHREYLICTECGLVESITHPCPVDSLEQNIAIETGFTGLYHELQFFGICPKCA